MHITETQFVELLRRRAEHNARSVSHVSRLRRGIGEDCAVIACSSKNDLLITTDLFLEDVHFRRKWLDARSAGHKTLARGLSDIAAMGGIPRYVFLSLGLPPRLQPDWLKSFFTGFFKLASEAQVVLAGGDTGRSQSGFVADIMVAGEAPRGESILRSGAHPGDQIWVTGRLGLAAAGLELLQDTTRRASVTSLHGREYADALRAFRYPQPRLHIGRFLRERKLASAMIDLSDGLSLDLARLCKESRVGARVVEEAIPRNSQAPVKYALHGGEDLELLFTVPPRRSHAVPRSIGGVKLTRIGEIVRAATRGHNLVVVLGGQESPLPVRGFQHF